jgi:alkylhydroperoxidase/carboxymuconolactone decarboxylase family protein YurZ
LADEGTEVVETLKRLNTGGMIVVSWGKVLVGCIVFVCGVTAYVLQMKSDQQIETLQRAQLVKSFEDFKVEIRGRLDRADGASTMIPRIVDRLDRVEKDTAGVTAAQKQAEEKWTEILRNRDKEMANVLARLR